MRLRYGIFAALPLIVASSVGEPNDGSRSLSSADPARGQVQDSLRVELIVPDRVRAGETVRFTLQVQNVSTRTFDLYLRGRETTFDVQVSNASGALLWQRLAAAVIPAIVHIRPLAPRERFELTADWDQRDDQGKPVGPAEYKARGFLLAEGAPLATERKTLMIVAR